VICKSHTPCPKVLQERLIGIGAAVTRLPLPHHRAYGSVHGRVTNLETPSRAVVRFYNKRGTAEQWIKEGKQAVKMTRLSCHRFPLHPSAAGAAPAGLQLGEFVAAAGFAERD
jgi:hypothetical protein